MSSNSEFQQSQENGHHSENPGMEWLVYHTGNFILPFGKAFENLMERTMMPAVNGIFGQLARTYLFISTPVLVILLIHDLLG
jgi:hypothetical protein